MISPLPIDIQTAYQNLLDRHRRQPSVSIGGSLMKKAKSGRDYWIARRRIGSRTFDEQVGPDTPDIRAKVDRARKEQAALQEWEQVEASLVAQLRAAGARTLDMQTGKLLNAIARSGFFRAGGILAGTHAFALYELELGVRFEMSMVRTEDIDILAARGISIATTGKTETMSGLFGELGLTPVGGAGDASPVSWQTSQGTPVDILTPRRRGGQDIVRHEKLGVYAQALPYIEFAMEAPIEAVALYRSGILVRIPSPERYAIHKLIVASLRQGTHRAKSAKDLAQAATLIEVLKEQRPYELETAYEDAVDRGKSWHKAIESAFKARPDIKAHLDEL